LLIVCLFPEKGTQQIYDAGLKEPIIQKCTLYSTPPTEPQTSNLENNQQAGLGGSCKRTRFPSF
jgi:hypothetical protein